MIIKDELHQSCDFAFMCPLCTLGNSYAFLSLVDIFYIFFKNLSEISPEFQKV